jgi:4-alpha-glucanotransferase
MIFSPFHALAHRCSGVLLHITSLPGAHGSGDLGAHAYHFIDWLASAGQRLWQILPLSPVGPGHSPYASPSAFAGNPLLIDLEDLVRQGWLTQHTVTQFDAGRCDFDRVTPYRMDCLREAWRCFSSAPDPAVWAAFNQFRSDQSEWLQNYSLFMALEARYGSPWTQWPHDIAQCNPDALRQATDALANDIGFFCFVQWRFYVQWQALRVYAHQSGVAIVGDAPIFVAHHSADVWSNAAQYELDVQGEPTVVAGVPPDYFSATGQRWGNPLYRWDAMRADGFSWWKARFAHLCSMVDLVRIDHFRAFDSYWEIPASEPTAVRGQWREGPGVAVFEALATVNGHHSTTSGLPIIAEDLGDITPSVTTLRLHCGFPGMSVLQFAFADTPANAYLPHNFVPQTVAYTGTHDNDTTVGWWHNATAAERLSVRRYLGEHADREIHWSMIHALSQSVATTVIFPFQDILGLDGSHRMNTPGVDTKCWQWRFDWHQVGDQPARRLAAITNAHGRNLYT